MSKPKAQNSLDNQSKKTAEQPIERTTVEIQQQQAVRALRGKLHWEGSLSRMHGQTQGKHNG